jgi:transposase
MPPHIGSGGGYFTGFCADRIIRRIRVHDLQAGSRLYTDSASSYRALKGYVHEFVNHTQKEYARGDVHENRAECLFSLLKPYLQVFRGMSKRNMPGYVGFFQFLRNVANRMRKVFHSC